MGSWTLLLKWWHPDLVRMGSWPPPNQVTQSILASAAIDDVEEVVAGVVTVSTLPLVVYANNFFLVSSCSSWREFLTLSTRKFQYMRCNVVMIPISFWLVRVFCCESYLVWALVRAKKCKRAHIHTHTHTHTHTHQPFAEFARDRWSLCQVRVVSPSRYANKSSSSEVCMYI